MDILRLHQPVNLGGDFGFLPKGEYKIKKNAGNDSIDPDVLQHWLIKGMLNDGLAVIIRKSETKILQLNDEKPKRGGKGKTEDDTPSGD